MTLGGKTQMMKKQNMYICCENQPRAVAQVFSSKFQETKVRQSQFEVNLDDIQYSFSKIQSAIMNSILFLISSLTLLLAYKKGFIFICGCVFQLHNSRVQCPQRPEEGSRPSGAEVTGRHEPSDVSAGNQTRVTWKSSKHS